MNGPEEIRTLAERTLATMRAEGRAPEAPQACECGNDGCNGYWYPAPDGGPDLRCPLFEAGVEREERRTRAEGAGLNLARYRRSWRDLHVEHESWEFIREVCFNPVAHLIDTSLCLVLSGPRGTGKSQAGAMLVNATQTVGRSARYVVWPAWWTSVKGTFGRDASTDGEASLVRELVRPDVLVLDEIGSALDERSPYAWALLESIIGARYDAMRSTVLATNLTPLMLAIASSGYAGDRARDMEDQIRAGSLSVDALPSPLYSRLQHSAAWLTFDGPNYRAREDARRRDDAVARIRDAMQARRERS